MHRANDVDMPTLRSWLTRPAAQGGPRVVIANVLGVRHFVLVVGWDEMDGDTLIVRDSGFNRTTYSHARDVVGWRVFDMAPQADKRPPRLSERPSTFPSSCTPISCATCIADNRSHTAVLSP